MTDYKQHCIKLLQILDTNWPLGLPTTWAKWADAVRADLAKPEPEGLTDEDLVETVRQSMEDCIFVSELLYYNREPLMHILRTVLARWGNHPGSPDRLVQPELEEPSFGDVIEWVSGIEPWATWLAPGGCLENAHFEFGHLVTAAVARWGSSQGILDNSTPQPAAGEVEELVDLIRQNVALAWEPAACMLGNMTAGELTRVAELLEQLNPPQPVPVSERLPGPEDCDAEGRCWWFDIDGQWYFRSQIEINIAGLRRPTHWLPAHALPLPS